MLLILLPYHLVPLPSSLCQWPLLRFRPSLLWILFQTPPNQHGTPLPKRGLRSTILMSQLGWKSRSGNPRAFRIKSDLPYLSFFALSLYIGPIFLAHPRSSHAHTLSWALKKDFLQFPPWSLYSYHFLSLLPHLPGKYWHTLQVLPPLNPSLICLLFPEFWPSNIDAHIPLRQSLSTFLFVFTCLQGVLPLLVWVFRAGHWAEYWTEYSQHLAHISTQKRSESKEEKGREGWNEKGVSNTKDT